MCYVITPAGRKLLRASDRTTAAASGEADAALPSSAGPRRGEGWLRQARHDVHVAGWVLALERLAGSVRPTLHGAADSALSPPMRASADGRVALGPADLRLPGGRTAHDFFRTNAGGESLEVERFETVRPDAIVEIGRGGGTAGAGRQAFSTDGSAAGTPVAGTPTVDVMIELDDRLPVGRSAGKLERYDHFLAGWSEHTIRYGRRKEALPVVVFVCRDRARARECARRADTVLRACRAYAGEYPVDWEYPGRETILFVSERDIHEGRARAFGVSGLPPEVRVTVAHGDPRAGEAVAEPRRIPGLAPPKTGLASQVPTSPSTTQNRSNEQNRSTGR